VLALELMEKSYAWEFISEHGQVLDSGVRQCHPKSQTGNPKEGAL
jgi:hypothetical protein